MLGRALLILGKNGALHTGIMHAVGMISQCFVDHPAGHRVTGLVPPGKSKPLGLVLEARERDRYVHPEVSERTVSNGFSWRETPQCMLADDALIFMKCSLGWNRVSTATFVLGRVFQLSLAHRRKPVFSPSSVLHERIQLCVSRRLRLFMNRFPPNFTAAQSEL